LAALQVIVVRAIRISIEISDGSSPTARAVCRSAWTERMASFPAVFVGRDEAIDVEDRGDHPQAGAASVRGSCSAGYRIVIDDGVAAAGELSERAGPSRVAGRASSDICIDDFEVVVG